MHFFLAIIIDIIGLLAFLSLTKIDKEQNIKEFNLVEFKNILAEYIGLDWLKYVVYLNIIFALLFSASADFKNLFQESIGFSISIIGILWSISRVGISGLLLLSDWFKRKLQLKHIIFI